MVNFKIDAPDVYRARWAIFSRSSHGKCGQFQLIHGKMLSDSRAKVNGNQPFELI
jgi:hypothetical protein